MSRFGISTLGALTSTLLAIVTLFVFGTLQNYGPESTVRRFHQAAAELDSNMAADLVDPNFDSEATRQVWTIAATFLVNDRASVNVAYYQRQSDRAVILAKYTFPGGEQQSLIWVVNLEGNKWRIDSNGTVRAARYLLNPVRVG